MSTQKFSSAEREALWLAHRKKCAYTRHLLDVSSFHIDHVVPESLADKPEEFQHFKEELGLPEDFDVRGYENLLPCRPGANMQKNAIVFEKASIHYFLGIAASKKADVEEHLDRIESRSRRGRAVVLLQQCLERGDLSADEVSDILVSHSENPDEIFTLLEGMTFADSAEIRKVAKSDISELRDRPIVLGPNTHIDGVTLTNDMDQKRLVRTCLEYDKAVQDGYFALTTFDIKMSSWFEHQYGLLRALNVASRPSSSFVSEPTVGVVDLGLLPYSVFPDVGEEDINVDPSETYQSKVDDGTLVIRKVRQNLLQIEEPHGMGQQLIEVLRADFNDDGIEDLLLFEYCYATEGSLGFGGIRILTRLSSTAKFKSIRLDAS